MPIVEHEDMRVAIARDVLAQLDREDVPLRVSPEGYVSGFYEPKDWSADLQQIVDEVKTYCDVCALGGLILSKARLYDSVPICELLEEDPDEAPGEVFGIQATIYEQLDQVFGQGQRELIETAFMEVRYFARALSEAERTKAVRYGGQFHDDRLRLRAIMENIIANGGEFRPESPTSEKAQ